MRRAFRPLTAHSRLCSINPGDGGYITAEPIPSAGRVPLDKVSRSPAGLGSSPTSIFAGPVPCKNFGVWPHPNCLPKRATRNMAQKNGGYAFFYVSSVSFDAFIACIVASTIFNSLSSKAFNMASIRFLHSLPLFWDG